MIDGSGTAPKS